MEPNLNSKKNDGNDEDAAAGPSLEGPAADTNMEVGNGSDPVDLVTARAQDLTVEDASIRVEEEGSAKAGPTDSTTTTRTKPCRSGAAKRRARKARLALQGPPSEPAPKDKANLTEGAAGEKGSVKRPRPSDSTPPEKYTAIKRSKMFPRPTGYVEAAAADKKLVIAPVDYPGSLLGQGQDELVARELLAALDSIPQGKEVPRFEGTRCDQGALWVTCSDEMAKKWLRETVPLIKPWEGASLRVFERECLPRLVRMTAVFPGSNEDMRAALTRLQRQNPGLQTPLWRVWDRRQVKGATHVVLGVDAISLERLKASGLAPHFGLGRARFYEAQHRTTGERQDGSPEGLPGEQPREGQPRPEGAGAALPPEAEATAAPEEGKEGPGAAEPVVPTAEPAGSWTAAGRGKRRARGRPTKAQALARGSLTGSRGGVQRTLDGSLPGQDKTPRGPASNAGTVVQGGEGNGPQ